MSSSELLSLASGLHQAGRLTDAVRAYDKAIAAAAPAPLFGAHLNKCTALLDLGELAEALAAVDASLAAADALGNVSAAGRGMAWYNRANVLSAMGRHEASALSYHKALKLDPTDADAAFNLGNALDRLQRHADAAKSFAMVIRLDPDHVDAFMNRGVSLFRLKRHDEALASFDQALLLDPTRVCEVESNRGDALREEGGRHQEALEAYDRSIEAAQEATAAEGRAGGGSEWSLSNVGGKDGGAASSENTLTSTMYKRARLLSLMGNEDAAVAAFRDLLSLAPDHARASHMLAALDAGGVDDGNAGAAGGGGAALNAYVTQEFDAFASTFEATLVGRLQYQTPQVLAEALASATTAAAAAPGSGDDQASVLSAAAAAAAGGPREKSRTLDLGCGTGLCAPWLRPLSCSLVGVDLSSEMCRQAAARTDARYDELLVDDIVAVCKAPERAGMFDLVVAADTLCYLPDLSPLFEGVASVLGDARTANGAESGAESGAERRAGMFVFSFELLKEEDSRLVPRTNTATVEEGKTRKEDEEKGAASKTQARGWELRRTGRFAHSFRYVQRIAESHGFVVCSSNSHVGRMEAGQPLLMGHFVLTQGHDGGS
jgi:predicted TPR repeat methyltransferase